MPSFLISSLLSFSRAATVCLSFFLLIPSRSPAQGQPQTGPSGTQVPAVTATSSSSAPLSLSTTVDEVSFDLTVRAKHGKPILDLQPSQLAVTDGGSPVKFSSLRFVDSGSGSQQLVSLVFDQLDLNAAKMVRKIAANILGTIPEKGYSIAVFQVDGRLRLLQSFTQDRNLINVEFAKELSASHDPTSSGLTPAEKTLIATVHSDALTRSRAEGKLLLSALEQSQHIVEDRRSYPSLAALQALVDSSRLLTGRKFIFYFSAGINANSDARDILQSIVGQATRAGVTICIVDTSRVNAQVRSSQQASLASSILGTTSTTQGVSAFGVGNLPGSAPSGGFTPGASGKLSAVNAVAGFQFGDASTEQSPLASLAFGTGGIYIGSLGGYKHQLQRFHEDLSGWYEASWVPPIKNYDGQFRPVVIHSLRKSVVIRSRSGYFAVPPQDASEIRPFEMPLLNILAKPTLPTDIAFHTRILHLGALPDGNSSELLVQVPVSELEAHEDPTTHISSAHAIIFATIKDSKGTLLGRFGDDFPLHETADRLRLDSDQVITLQEHFSANPGVYTLETAVMDGLANKVGAQRTTFTIEDLPHGPALSDIAVVKSVDPDGEDNQTFEPMSYRDGRVVPNLATKLAQGTRSLSLYFLVHPAPGSQSKPALRMQVNYNRRLVADMPMELSEASEVGAFIPYLATIRGHVFPAGEYEVKALLSQDGATVSSSVSFGVEGTSATSDPTGPSFTTVGSDSSHVSDAQVLSEVANAGSRLVITNTSNPVPPPTDTEIQTMVEGARQRALIWSNSLVNFFCYEVTKHFVDASGRGDWKLKDHLVERMSYIDHQESRTTLLLNGDRSGVHADQLQFVHSAGEFGAVFQMIFNPSAKTSFTWKQYAVLDGLPVQVFAFKVVRANSSFDLSDRADRNLPVGFHGLLYLDPATESIRRITIDADDIPSKLLIRASSMSVDYAWISMQSHDFLLPIRGAVSLQEIRRRPILNEFEFDDYHRFGSQSRVLTHEDSNASSKN